MDSEIPYWKVILNGLSNILHFYVFVFVLVLGLFFLAQYCTPPVRTGFILVGILATSSTLISLLASFYVYDLAGLYNFTWLDQQNTTNTVVNINAGFDETSTLLKAKFKQAELIVLDFYDPSKHTEISIKRARKAYPPFPGTQQVETGNLQLLDDSVDKIFVILSAHEIRDESERLTFFKALKRGIKPGGQIYIIEHLRDVPNFLAYNIGFFHFHAKSSWLKTFQEAGLNLKQEIKHTPFISNFILDKNGNTL